MTTKTSNTARCRVGNYQIEAAAISTAAGGINLGVDGWLVGVARTARQAEAMLTEWLRMRAPLDSTPELPQSFRDDLAKIGAA